MARPFGKTKAKKAIRKQDFEKLLDFVGKNKMMNYPTRSKLKIAYTLLYCTGCRISEIVNFTKEDLEYMVKFKGFYMDRLAELEKVILDYYLDKGYEVYIGDWDFNVSIDSDYKSKQLEVWFNKGDGLPYQREFFVKEETIEEMFDKAFNYFSLKKGK